MNLFYFKLGRTINFRKAIILNGTLELYKNGTYKIPNDIIMLWNVWYFDLRNFRILFVWFNFKDRSILISTYALCGFANFATIGVQIAILTLFAPNRSQFISKNVTKAMFAGNISSFMNACIAGLLFKKI